jgi:hypothetical protein
MQPSEESQVLREVNFQHPIAYKTSSRSDTNPEEEEGSLQALRFMEFIMHDDPSHWQCGDAVVTQSFSLSVDALLM